MITQDTPAPLSPEDRERIAALIGDAKPATDRLLMSFGESVRDRREHEHPTWEDLYCANLAAYMGERMGPVLRRLLDVEAEVERVRAELDAAQSRAKRYRIAWGMARTRALSAGGAADRAAARDQARQQLVDELLVQSLAAQMERDEVRARAAELDRACDEVTKERDHLHDVADKLAYAVAPIEVIGEHSSENDPWENALDLITPAAEVERLRAELEQQRGSIEYECPKCCRWAPWANGRAIEHGDEVDEFWCPACGAETPLSACAQRTELERLRAELEAERRERAADHRTWQHDLSRLRETRAWVEALAERARAKGNTEISTDDLLEALGLNED